MKVTKQQKVLGGVLVLGALAMLVDRFVPSGSDAAPDAGGDASAYAVAAPAHPTPVTDANAAASASASNQPTTIAQRLRDVGSRATTNPSADASFGDAFAFGTSWRPAEPSPDAVPAATTAKPADPAETATKLADAFKRSHNMTGVLTAGGRGFAMIDGKIFAVGQCIDGFKLIAISGRAATFEADRDGGDVKVVLTLAETAAATLATAR